VLLFLLVAFGIATPAFLAITPNTTAISSFALLMIGSYAPAIGAMVTLRLQGSPEKRLEFKERLLRWRVDLSWYAIAVLLPSGVWLIAFTHCVIAGTYVGANPQALLYLPFIIITSFGEETGWRGFLLPRLFARTGPVSSSLLLGLIWGIFHVPLFWRDPTSLILILISSLAMSIILTWLFIGSGESVLLTTLTHAVFITWGQVLLPISIYVFAIAIALISLWALFLVMRFGPCLTNLSATE
jgi:membrane protease YdiL (CAAX protease family)